MECKSSICPVCGKAFEPKRGAKFGSKFCSMKCYQKDWYARKVASARRICPICGKEFHPDTDHRSYCSPECLEEGRRLQRREYKKRDYNKPGHIAAVHEHVCDFCGKTFTTKVSNQRFCSKQCQKTADNEMRNAARAAARVILKKTCVWCGKEFETTRHDKLCCSSECSYNYNNHHCSSVELEAKRQAKREEAARKAAEKALKTRVNGLTEAQMQAVIDAQDGDPSQLYRLSQSWTPAQHKFAKSRYESNHGLFSQTFRG